MAENKNEQSWVEWYRDATITAQDLPDILVEAMRISQTIVQGSHGRKRPGTGETFWQFRRYSSSDSATRIDWRRSGRDDGIYIREQEWEAAHTIWLWANMSRSMRFHSSLSQTGKNRRAMVLMLALAEMLVRAGERVAIPSLTRPSYSIQAPLRMAQAVGASEEFQNENSLPPLSDRRRKSDYVMISDFLTDFTSFETRAEQIAEQGSRIHLLQVFDPVEETFPFEGHVEFEDPTTGDRMKAGKAQELKNKYIEKLEAHRHSLKQLAARLGGSFHVHHTDKPPQLILLALQNYLSSDNPFEFLREGITQDFSATGEPLRAVEGT